MLKWIKKDHGEKINEDYVWDAYLHVTRGVPTCGKKEFLEWLNNKENNLSKSKGVPKI